MKKRALILFLLIVSCAQIEEPLINIPQNESAQAPEQDIPETIKQTEINKTIEDIEEHTIRIIEPFSLISTDAMQDNFGIIAVERYDARYQAEKLTVTVHVFKFQTREELDAVMNSEFYYITALGATRHQGNTIAIYLNDEDHRTVIWTSGKKLIYIQTHTADFAALEIINAYLEKNPSDLKTQACMDSDGNDHFFKGTVTNVKINSQTIEWTDVCLRDFELYKNKQYKPKLGLNEEDGLLEGRCTNDPSQPGHIEEYVCHKGCQNGACKTR